MMAGALSVALIGIGSAVGYSFAQGLAPSAPLEVRNAAWQPGFARLVSTVKSAVVSISTEQAVKSPLLHTDPYYDDFLQQFFGQNWQQMLRQSQQPTHALGSGFIVDPAGYVVTNNHVIDDATDIEVTLTDGSRHRAHVVGRDAKTDIALLKINSGHELPYVSFGNSDQTQVGDWVVAMGNPYGLGGSVSAGVVSGERRDINTGPYDSFLQVDAPINPGNSGGPLFDQSGHVIGIDTAIYTPSGGSVGIGFAIPSNVARGIVAQLREHGHVARGWLGIQMQELTPSLAKAEGLSAENGVLVDLVSRGSPADHAGVEQGDVITRFDGKAIDAPRDLALAVANTASGQTVPLTVWRQGHERELRVTIGADTTRKLASAVPVEQRGAIGIVLAPLTQEQRAEQNLSGGAVVESVVPGGRADQSGLEPGDVIIRVGSNAVHSPGDVISDIREAESAHESGLPLLIDRDGIAQYLALNLNRGTG